MSNMNDSGVCVINVNGEDVKLRFGMPANREIFSRLLDEPDMLNADKIDERGVTVLIYAGYVNACMAEDKPVTKSFEYFFEFVEDNVGEAEVFQTVANCYSNSRHTKKMIDKVNTATEDIKKKTLTGTSSSPSATENSDGAEGSITA